MSAYFYLCIRMHRVGYYSLSEPLLELSPNLTLWSAQDELTGQPVEVLTCRVTEANASVVDRVRNLEVKILKQERSRAFQGLIDYGFDEDSQIFYLVYESLVGWNPLADQAERIALEALKSLLEDLHEAALRNRFTLALASDYILVDPDNLSLKLRFLGLFDLFRVEGCIDLGCASPELRAWLEDCKKNPRPNSQDDQYALFKLLQPELFWEFPIPEDVQSVWQKATAPSRAQRYKDWRSLREAIEECERKYPYKGTILLRFHNDPKRPSSESDRANFVATANTSPFWILLNEQLSKNGYIWGYFNVGDYSGSLSIAKDGKYLYIFYFYDSSDNSILDSRYAFKLDGFRFSLDEATSDPDELLAFFNAKFRERVEVNRKESVYDNWSKIPDTEKKYIERNALEFIYDSFELLSNDSIKFRIKSVNRKAWDKDVSKFWDELRKRLIEDKEAIELNQGNLKVGQLASFDAQEKAIEVRPVMCDVESLRKHEGILKEDVTRKISPYKKQIWACEQFEMGAIQNLQLSALFAKPEHEPLPEAVPFYEPEYEDFEEELLNRAICNDKSQRNIVFEALHRKPIYIIQGPPGTGKTTVIVEIVRQLIKRNPSVKILITSQSNTAVDNILSRLVKEDPEIRVMRLASTLEKVSSEMRDIFHLEQLRRWIERTRKAALQRAFASLEPPVPLEEAFIYYTYIPFRWTKDWEKWSNKMRATPEWEREARSFSGKVGITFDHKKLLMSLESLKSVNNFDETDKLFEDRLPHVVREKMQILHEWMGFLGAADPSRLEKTRFPNSQEIASELTKTQTGPSSLVYLLDGIRPLRLDIAMMKYYIQVVGATCIHIASGVYEDYQLVFDYVIMDESSKATPGEALVPLSMARNVVLVGDHKQLPPVVTTDLDLRKEIEDQGIDLDKEFGESLFEKLILAFERDPKKSLYCSMLTTQYRMPRQIAELVSKHFYDGKLKSPSPSIDPDYDKKKAHNLPLKKNTSIIFLSTSKLPEPWDNDNKAFRQNRTNARVIKEIIKKLDQICKDNPKSENPLSIGIIAGYRGQVALLKETIRPREYRNFIKETRDGEFLKREYLISIDTVDRFQGEERDIIIYDVVRSSPSQSNIGFLIDYRRMNVAFSRAKRLLIIVGDSEYVLERAIFIPDEEKGFVDFKLKSITKELKNKGLIFYSLSEIFS